MRRNWPLISVVAIFHDMPREAPRTLFSLTRDYQEAGQDLAYEVIDDWDIAPDPSVIRPEQLELRESVNSVNLSCELARLSINLIPLEDTVFCASKSPLKWYEAALAGTPSIATAQPRYRELFREQSLGLLATDTPSWIAQIDRLATDASLRTTIAADAAQHCEELFDVRKIAGQYLEI